MKTTAMYFKHPTRTLRFRYALALCCVIVLGITALLNLGRPRGSSDDFSPLAAGTEAGAIGDPQDPASAAISPAPAFKISLLIFRHR